MILDLRSNCPALGPYVACYAALVMPSATRTAETSGTTPESGLAAVRALVAEVRASCLWFLASDFLPESREEALSVLRSIERHGDRETYIRAREL